MLVEFGLKSAHEAVKDPVTGETVRDERGLPVYKMVAEPGPRVLTILVPDQDSTKQAFAAIEKLIQWHSPEAPAWVECLERPVLQSLLVEEFKCAAGKPADVEQTHYTLTGPPTAPVAEAAPPVAPTEPVVSQ